jgi:alpha-1,2-mannosyltransferase
MTSSQQAPAHPTQQPQTPSRRGSGLLLTAGLVAFAAAIALYVGYAATHPMRDWMEPVDLRVYRFGGLIAAHVAPFYHARFSSPLYQWPGFGNLKFTYSPFAALVFTVLTVPSLGTLLKLSIAVNIAALLATIWYTFGGLGFRAGRARAGSTLLVAAAVFWTEPVLRTLFLGQVELVLMALIMWDMCQPDRRWWKGAGVGIAAGIKLVPLIFIPYLLLTRRYRQAGVAAGTFGGTVALGFIAMPADSRRWWLDGVFAQGTRTGFVGWEGNQSLRGLITRLVGSVAGAEPAWLVAAALAVIAGLACAAVLHRAGYPVVGLLTCALTGLLVSPISWDHHWVWIVPAIATAVGYAVRARGTIRWALVGLAATIAALFGAWPGSLWGEPQDLGAFSYGLIWAPPNTNPGTYYRLGDRPWFVEYHWHGLQLLTGNLYLLTGLALFGLLLAFAAVSWRRGSRVTGSGTGEVSRPRAEPQVSPSPPGPQRGPDPDHLPGEVSTGRTRQARPVQQ